MTNNMRKILVKLDFGHNSDLQRPLRSFYFKLVVCIMLAFLQSFHNIILKLKKYLKKSTS